jgi:hypothetical protein
MAKSKPPAIPREREWLNGAERARLQLLEDTIERGLRNAVVIGQALVEIRDTRLYRESGATFEEYCKQRFGLSRSQGYRYVALVETRQAVSPKGDSPAPANERVARELAPLRDDPEAMREAWNKAVEQHGDTPTADQVREVVRGPEAPGDDTRFEAIEDANAVLRLMPAAERIVWPVEPGDVDAIDAEVKELLDHAKQIARSWSLHKRALRGLRAVN